MRTKQRKHPKQKGRPTIQNCHSCLANPNCNRFDLSSATSETISVDPRNFELETKPFANACAYASASWGCFTGPPLPIEFKHITTEVGKMKVEALILRHRKSTFALAGSSPFRAAPPVTWDADGTKRRYFAFMFCGIFGLAPRPAGL